MYNYPYQDQFDPNNSYANYHNMKYFLDDIWFSEDDTFWYMNRRITKDEMLINFIQEWGEPAKKLLDLYMYIQGYETDLSTYQICENLQVLFNYEN